MMYIDRCNILQAGVVSLPDFTHVKYINLRNTLASGAGNKKVWVNELHPNGDGFVKVTDKFAKVLGGLP
jgi:hypothetical protein